MEWIVIFFIILGIVAIGIALISKSEDRIKKLNENPQNIKQSLDEINTTLKEINLNLLLIKDEIKNLRQSRHM